MRLSSISLLPELTNVELAKLVFEQKETLDTYLVKKTKKFSSVDAWNIRRQKKIFVKRRFISGL